MWVDYRGPLSTVYNDGEISTCEQIIEVHSVKSVYICTYCVLKYICIHDVCTYVCKQSVLRSVHTYIRTYVMSTNLLFDPKYISTNGTRLTGVVSLVGFLLNVPPLLFNQQGGRLMN